MFSALLAENSMCRVSERQADGLSGLSSSSGPFDRDPKDFPVVAEALFRFVAVCGNFPNGLARRDAFRKVALEYGYTQKEITEISLEFHQPTYILGRNLADHCNGKLIFSCSDCYTADMIRALEAAGKKFGQDYEIIGYDNSEGEGFRPFSEPIITSVSSDNETCAILAAKLLIEKIRVPDSTTTIIRVPTRLTIRKTALTHKGGAL